MDGSAPSVFFLFGLDGFLQPSIETMSLIDMLEWLQEYLNQVSENRMHPSHQFLSSVRGFFHHHLLALSWHPVPWHLGDITELQLTPVDVSIPGTGILPGKTNLSSWGSVSHSSSYACFRTSHPSRMLQEMPTH